jgi:hypothetical protein
LNSGKRCSRSAAIALSSRCACAGSTPAREREPHVRLSRRVHETESGGQHADHVERAAVERDGHAGDRPSPAVPAIPQTTTDHDAAGGGAIVVAGVEAATDLRPRAEHVEQVRRDDRVLDFFRLTIDARASPGHTEARIVERGPDRQRLECACAFAHVEEVRER